MARTKITAYVTPDVADALKRLAAITDRSMSDIIEDAICRRLSDTGRETEHAALVAKLDHLARRLGRMEAAQETHFELSAQSARFAMSVAPDIPEAERQALNARGGERLRNLLGLIVTRLASGRSTWREAMANSPVGSGEAAPLNEAAQ